MRKVYSCVDIGSHSIKIVVVEEMNNKFFVLSKTIQKTKGVRRGKIIGVDLVVESLKLAFNKIETELGIKLDNVLCIVPSEACEIEITVGEVDIKDGVVDNDDVSKVLQNAVFDKVREDEFLVSNIPVVFSVDDKEKVKDAVGMSGNKLKVKSVYTKMPKSNVIPFFDVFKKLNKNIIDVSLGIVGDYYVSKDKNLDKITTAVINIGYESINVGIFNKGILIKNEIIDSGSRLVDKDISYIYDLKRSEARFLKETFAVSNTRYADVNDITVIENRSGQILNINQLEISEIVEARLRDMLKLAKKQINLLTNKEIRYIIVTGGITEIAGFQYLIENVFGYSGCTLVINEMGVRSNSYSSSLGFVKYFSDKMIARGKDYSMINDNNLDIMTKKYRKTTSENGKVNILNIFTGNNKED